MAMRDWIIKDLGWKFFSVVLAVAIWLTVYKIRSESESASPGVGIQEPATFNNIPILIVSSAADVRDYHVSPATVTVTVSGAPDDIAKLHADQVRAFVDLTGIDVGNLHRHVDVTMPSGLSLVNVDPREVDVVVPPPRAK
jgi:YbbR domain-containing protein